MASPVQSSSAISSLLRLIQQERSQAPTAAMPTADPSAPVREAVSTPLESPIAPESPGSDTTIALRPEGMDAVGGEAPVIAPGRSMVGSIGGVPGGVVGATTPEPAPETMQEPVVDQIAPSPQLAPSPAPNNPQVLGATTGPQSISTKLRSSVTPPKVTPAATPKPKEFIGPTRPPEFDPSIRDAVAAIDQTIKEINDIISGSRDQEFLQKRVVQNIKNRIQDVTGNAQRKADEEKARNGKPEPVIQKYWERPKPTVQSQISNFVKGIGTKIKSFF